MHSSLSKYFLSTLFLISINVDLLSAQIDYSTYDEILKEYVHGNRVDYENLLQDKDKVIAFTEALGKISPDSNPEQFNTRNEKLAYWINAYNAFILKIIIENYPVKSIKDINFIGFTIWLNKNLIGGENISFKSLEDDIIRHRFKDPRIHFAINCASYSCPPLINNAYMPATLEQQLETSTQNFINDLDNLKIDRANKKLYLSSIFDWYDDDFYDFVKINRKIEEPHLLDFIKLYYTREVLEEWYSYEIVYFDYNWDLNDL